jgi:hypothetical protein
MIWTIGGDCRWDALPSDPSELANQLVEVLPVDARTKVYRDAARLWVLVAGQALQRQREHPTVARMAALCRPGGLALLLKAQSTHMADLPRLSQTEMDGVLSLGTSLSVLSRGVAGRSLGAGADALRLEDAMTAGNIVLLQMAAGPYPEETRMLGAWALRCMLRLLRLPEPCVLICDEFARLGVQGRAALELLSLGREFGKPVILCTQGPSDFGELGHHALDQAAQDAAWVLAFRQGTRDSTTASRLLGVCWGQECSRSTGSNAARENVRIVEQPYVSASALEDLEPGTAHLRVPSVDGRRTRVEHVRVAFPSLVGRGRDGMATRGGAQRSARPYRPRGWCSLRARSCRRCAPPSRPRSTRTCSACWVGSSARVSGRASVICGQRRDATTRATRSSAWASRWCGCTGGCASTSTGRYRAAGRSTTRAIPRRRHTASAPAGRRASIGGAASWSTSRRCPTARTARGSSPRLAQWLSRAGTTRAISSRGTSRPTHAVLTARLAACSTQRTLVDGAGLG